MVNFERHLASLLLTVSSYYDAVLKKETLYVPVNSGTDKNFIDFPV
jgi:hypothetical protein